MPTITVEQDEPDVSITAPVDRDWWVSDRLTAADISQLVESFEKGTTLPELVTRYSISRSNVKKLLRRRGARRHPRPGSSL